MSRPTFEEILSSTENYNGTDHHHHQEGKPKLTSRKEVWLQKQKVRNNLLNKSRARFCNSRELTRKDLPLPERNLGIMCYYLDLDGNNFSTILDYATTVRKILTNISNQLITQVIDSGIPTMLAKLIDEQEVAKYFNISEGSIRTNVNKKLQSITRFNLNLLQFEAVWALTNVSSGSSAHTQHVVSLGCIEKILKLIECNGSCADLVEQCFWALGNICGDSVGYRDLVLSHGALSIMLPFFKTNPTTYRLSFLRNGRLI